MTLEVLVIPLLRDNHGYALVDRSSGTAVVIDPSEADPVSTALHAASVRPVAVWCTHHHADHVGGVPGLLERHPELPVLGSAFDLEHGRIPGQTRGLRDGEELVHGGVAFDALSVPGHTLGALAYVGAGHAFTGDTLFLAGCGRVFEGTMPQMRASLARLASLPASTRLWVGHEYTARNLDFAATVEPENLAVAARLEAVRRRRAAFETTMPGTIAEERATTPMLRWDAEAVLRFAARRGAAATPDEVFARVREAKDAF